MLWVIHVHNLEKPEGIARNYYKSKDENILKSIGKVNREGKGCENLHDCVASNVAQSKWTFLQIGGGNEGFWKVLSIAIFQTATHLIKYPCI